MAFKGRDSITSKIVISNKMIEKINPITWDSHCHTKEKKMLQAN